MSAYAAGVEQLRKTRERLFDTSQYQLAQWPAKPVLLGCSETEFVAAIAYSLRQDSLHCLPQYALGVGADDFVMVTDCDREFDQALVQKRHPCLDAVCHAVAV